MTSTRSLIAPSLLEAWLQYNQLVDALECYQASVSRGAAVSRGFRGLMDDEIIEHFELLKEELNAWGILSLIATAEAIIRRDYLRRVRERKKDSLSRYYRELERTKGKSVRLKDDLLHQWTSISPSTRGVVHRFFEILPIRHWIAHGRYYVLRARQVEISAIYSRVEELLNCNILLS